ncbi:hypothetical protein KRP22_015045 [Phytophthora ramorum]|uniref:E3 ubiquitin-protein ligase complex slx8-rfp subunit slx8 n=1 Tax=Phytophthora ramorum TaxID=164328 RepID=UPI003097DD28|nr:E3 ubiquitin-protein ligase complex slx8-rfp subunit slx8 [Phytophthora ramorum]KAH7504334.1 E3 ubiquitin-protein ligase complex slx8-rfp subunit slx8 [Phytophthora ramorum]
MTLPGRFLASRNSLSASNNNTVTASRTNNTRDNLLHDEDERWTSRDHFVLPHMIHFQDEFEADDNTGPAPTQPPEEIDLTLSSSEDEGGSRSAGSDVIEILEPTDAAPQPTPLRRKRRRPGAAPLLVPKRQRTMDMKSAESTNVSIHNSDVVEEFKAQLKCSICLDVLEDMTSTLCGHIFCAQCVHQAIRANGKCPLCQRRLHLKDTHRIYF